MNPERVRYAKSSTIFLMSVLAGGRLASMNSRVLLLVGALLASTAWSQQPVTNTPPHAPLVVALSNDSIKKIVRDTAATQSATVQLSNEKPVARKPLANIEFVPAVKAPPLKYPTRLPEPAPRSTGFLSALVDTLLDVDDDPSLGGKYPLWLSCQARDDLKSAKQQDACPSANPKDLRPSGLP
jgi:hypothetical protein